MDLTRIATGSNKKGLFLMIEKFEPENRPSSELILEGEGTLLTDDIQETCFA